MSSFALSSPPLFFCRLKDSLYDEDELPLSTVPDSPTDEIAITAPEIGPFGIEESSCFLGYSLFFPKDIGLNCLRILDTFIHSENDSTIRVFSQIRPNTFRVLESNK